jgi:hypothetical protein
MTIAINEAPEDEERERLRYDNERDNVDGETSLPAPPSVEESAAFVFFFHALPSWENCFSSLAMRWSKSPANFFLPSEEGSQQG